MVALICQPLFASTGKAVAMHFYLATAKLPGSSNEKVVLGIDFSVLKIVHMSLELADEFLIVETVVYVLWIIVRIEIFYICLVIVKVLFCFEMSDKIRIIRRASSEKK
jgi:hypothetical protein